MTRRTRYRLALGLAIATAVIPLWVMGAVGILGIEGDPADLLYLAVLAVAAAGSVLARLRADGMARTMAVAAGAVCLVAVAALAMGKHQAEYSSVLEILGLTAIFAGLFAGSGWLFRTAARPQPSGNEHQTIPER